MTSNTIRTIILFLIFALIIGGFFWYITLQKTYKQYLTQSVDSISESRINFTIEKNEPPKNIGERLFKENIIVSDWAFYKYVKESEKGPEIQAGHFILKKSYTIPEVVEFLTRARSEETVLTIREGLSIEQVDAYIAEQGLLLPGEFSTCARECEFDAYFFLEARPAGVNSLEGYLFADTYFVDADSLTARDLIKRMLDNFENKLNNSGLRSKIAETGRSIHDVVTMASIIEKEEKKKGQKPLISGILWKRLREGILLGVDATIRYATGKWTEPLWEADLNINSPYNTRTKRGLPPTPISNFSVMSLEAAINPEDSPYYYYLHDEEGNVHFAATNEEHNANKRKYL